MATKSPPPEGNKTSSNVGQKPGLLASIGLGGTCAVIAVNFTHPIELVKTRMQMTGAGVGATAGALMKNEGFLSFWKGIRAAWGRESFYASIKVGGYGPIRDAMGANSPDAPFALKWAAGATSGSLGAVVGNPFDVMKTMMQANSKEAVPLFALARRLHADQGASGFYRGVQANMARACVLNGTKMAVYDVSKGFITDRTGWTRKDPRTVFGSAIIARQDWAEHFFGSNATVLHSYGPDPHSRVVLCDFLTGLIIWSSSWATARTTARLTGSCATRGAPRGARPATFA